MQEIEVEFQEKDYLPKQARQIDKELNLIEAEDKLLKESIEEYIFMTERQQIFYNADNAMDLNQGAYEHVDRNP